MHHRSADPQDTRRMLAIRLGGISLVLALAAWALIAPLAVYQMDWMLWPWIWPAALGLTSAAAGAAAWRLSPPVTRRGAVLALGLGALALAAALLGFLMMLAGMYQMPPAMPMSGG